MNLERIDTHHHVFPPRYLKALDQLGLREAGGGDIAFPDWSPEASIAMRDRYAVTTAMVSISSPGVFFGDVRVASELAPTCNEYMVGLAHKYPGRFGVFASVPLPDVKAGITEATYALDTLNCDGIALLGSVADKFLGDPQFEQLIQELNRP
ncbi:MAG TPA: amidohydrolase family protein [Chthoniobacterales bacterium]|nr:amidohydrolase family protein [Chthoniobacterales bacterium]